MRRGDTTKGGHERVKLAKVEIDRQANWRSTR
jgi:hypothetical protein